MKTISIYALAMMLTTAAFSQETVTKEITGKVTKDQMAGSIFKHKDASPSVYNTTTETIDFVTSTSADEKFVTGVYSSGELHESYPDGYGMDEFWVLLSGSITLTSEDGVAVVYNPGDLCTISRDWKGRWDTEGYTKAYSVYVHDGVWPGFGKLEKKN
ncbi:MAG: DUF861 domain-containing protein [Cytophagales bacterium]|nr:DUF861 domain-containing protein [Cytophagales bacterium]